MARTFDIIRKKPKPATPPPPKRGKDSFGPFLLALVIVAAVIVIFGSFPSNQKKTTVEPTPTSTSFPTPSFKIQNLTPQTTVTPAQEESTPTPAPESSIRVLNGSYTAGAATQVKEILEKNGLSVREVGDARYKYNTTDIYYKPDKKELAQKIAEILKDFETTLNPSTTIVGEDDILVVVGIH